MSHRGQRACPPPICLDCGGGEGGPSPNPYDPPARWVFYHLDHLGSPRLVLNNAGAVVARHHYLPFGEERPQQVDPTLNTRAFTGHERDSETGLDYMLARYYSSSLGRFMAADPKVGSAKLELPQTWNRYTYALNNPLLLSDPDGKDALDDAKKAASKIASVKIGPSLGLEAKIKLGPIKAEAGGSYGAAAKLNSTGDFSVQRETSIGAKLKIGPLQVGFQNSTEATTVENGAAVAKPETKRETVAGISMKQGSAESNGEISAEGTLLVVKAAISFNPVALAETLVKSAIAIGEGLHNMVTSPTDAPRKPQE